MMPAHEALDLTKEDSGGDDGDVHAEEADMRAVVKEMAQISAKIRDLTARRLYLSEKKDALLNAKATRLNPERDWAAQFDWETEAHQLLRNPFGLAHFRPLQREAINCTLAKKDAVCILPSGGGKSLCYQLPALLGKKGSMTLVISPLLSLIQVCSFAKRKGHDHVGCLSLCMACMGGRRRGMYTCLSPVCRAQCLVCRCVPSLAPPVR